MTGDLKYYDTLWQRTGGKEHLYQPEKVAIMLRAIPRNVRTILDVGCGDGAITNILSKYYHVVGCDISSQGLKYLTGPVIICDSASLSFPDKSFDMVFTSELLEHLPDGIFDKSVAEIKRVAAEYILISVPNNEQLRSRFTVCRCGAEFHAYYHKRSFTASTLQAYFTGYKPVFSMACGPCDSPTDDFISYLRNKLAHSYFYVDGSICPECGQEITRIKTGIIRRLIGRGLYICQIALNIALRRRPQPDWLVMLLKRCEWQLTEI